MSKVDKRLGFVFAGVIVENGSLDLGLGVGVDDGKVSGGVGDVWWPRSICYSARIAEG